MNLKEFVEETISAIVEASMALQDRYEGDEVLINPPAPQSGSGVFHPGSANYTFRHVRDVEFDVALTVGSETSGSGKAGLKVFAAEIGGSGAHARSSEQVSRVRFTIPITLRPTKYEWTNRNLAESGRDAGDG